MTRKSPYCYDCGKLDKWIFNMAFSVSPSDGKTRCWPCGQGRIRKMINDLARRLDGDCP